LEPARVIVRERVVCVLLLLRKKKMKKKNEISRRSLLERRSEEVFGLYLGVWVIGRFHFVEFISVGLSFLRNGIITPFIRVCSFYLLFFYI
jgi:hypothetical protein